jgi:hypothetical protein
MVQGVSNQPREWYVVVDNDASWRIQTKGNALVGAAALSADDFQKMQFAVGKITKEPRKRTAYFATRNDFSR